MNFFINVLGWTGSLMVLTAYGLNSYQKLKSDSSAFYLLNFTGGSFLIVYTLCYEAYASTFINVVWVVVAIPAIFRIMKRKKSEEAR